jgi:hypothetical protein
MGESTAIGLGFVKLPKVDARILEELFEMLDRAAPEHGHLVSRN